MKEAPSFFARSVRTAMLLAGVAVGGGVLVLACTTKDGKKAYKCVAGEYYYCQCVDRQPGQALCGDDGKWGRCDPCETSTNPSIPPTGNPDPIPGDDDDADDDDVPPDSGPTEKPGCGNGKIEQGEICDDGNTSNDDGCDSSCQLSGASPTSSITCPGMDVHLWGGKEVTYTGTTTGTPNTGSVTPACVSGSVSANGAYSGDRVFHVTAHKTGTLTVKTTDTTFDSLLYVTTACKDRTKGEGDSTLYECANNKSSTAGETMAFAVQSGKSYSVFVDGVKVSQGNFKVSFSLP